MPDGLHRIADATALEAVLGAPMEQVRAKVGTRLNAAMIDFIALAPLVFVATIDASGQPDISPKGDPGGFVEVDADGNLLIPERLGNRLTFGFRNILRGTENGEDGGGEIGLFFIMPGQLETLRVKGQATLHTDPEVLARMAVSGKPALLFTHVQVQECFFHCGKAMIRSNLWKPEAWPQEARSIAARQFAGDTPPSEDRIRGTEAALHHSYTEELY